MGKDMDRNKGFLSPHNKNREIFLCRGKIVLNGKPNKLLRFSRDAYKLTQIVLK